MHRDGGSSELACPRCGAPMVRRKRRADGAEFWGCPTYPSCTGTRPLQAIETTRRVEPAPAIDGAVPWDDPRWEPARAGGSAQATYERRLARHRERVRQARPRIILIGVTIVVVGLVLVGASSTWAWLGYALVVLGILRTLTVLIEKPANVRAWRIGAAGEAKVGEILAALETKGCRVLHDRRRPGGRDNIDHVVIGPFGVVVVESKHYAGPVRVRGGELYLKGRRSTAMVEQVERQLASVREALGIADATGVICVIGGEFPLVFAPRSIGRVVLTSDRRLLDRLRSLPRTIDAAEVKRLADLAEQRLVPVVRG